MMTFPSHTLDATWPLADGAHSLEAAIDRPLQEGGKGGRRRASAILILSDRAMIKSVSPCPLSSLWAPCTITSSARASA